MNPITLPNKHPARTNPMALVGMEYKGIHGGGWRKAEFIKIGKLPFNSLPTSSSWLQNCEWRVTIDPMKTVVEAPGFWNELVVKKGGGWRTWEVVEPLTYLSAISGVGTIIVPKGFTTDLASIPRLFWLLVPPDGSYTPAAVLHDYLYRSGLVTRAQADRIFLEAMSSVGTWPGVRHTIWITVRFFGWTAYKRS